MKWIDHVTRFCALLAGYAMVGVTIFIVVAVLFRYALGEPIFGSQDVLEMVLIGATVLGMGYCARINGHIAVDLFERQLGRVGCLIGDVLSRVLGAGLMSLLAWGATEKLLDALEWGDATNLLQIPYWPFYGLIVISAFLYALSLVAELVVIARTGGPVEFQK